MPIWSLLVLTQRTRSQTKRSIFAGTSQGVFVGYFAEGSFAPSATTTTTTTTTTAGTTTSTSTTAIKTEATLSSTFELVPLLQGQASVVAYDRSANMCMAAFRSRPRHDKACAVLWQPTNDEEIWPMALLHGTSAPANCSRSALIALAAPGTIASSSSSSSSTTLPPSKFARTGSSTQPTWTQTTATTTSSSSSRTQQAQQAAPRVLVSLADDATNSTTLYDMASSHPAQVMLGHSSPVLDVGYLYVPPTLTAHSWRGGSQVGTKRPSSQPAGAGTHFLLTVSESEVLLYSKPAS